MNVNDWKFMNGRHQRRDCLDLIGIEILSGSMPEVNLRIIAQTEPIESYSRDDAAFPPRMHQIQIGYRQSSLVARILVIG